MAKKRSAGSDSTPSTPANAPAKRRSTPRAKDSIPVEAGQAETSGGSSSGRDSAPDMGPGSVNGAPGESAAPYAPTYEQIAEEAYHRYLSRGGSDGADFDDWLEAERRLRERRR
jgi:hypothetical protein